MIIARMHRLSRSGFLSYFLYSGTRKLVSLLGTIDNTDMHSFQPQSMIIDGPEIHPLEQVSGIQQSTSSNRRHLPLILNVYVLRPDETSSVRADKKEEALLISKNHLHQLLARTAVRDFSRSLCCSADGSLIQFIRIRLPSEESFVWIIAQALRSLDSGFELTAFVRTLIMLIALITQKSTSSWIKVLGDETSKLDVKKQNCTAMSSAEAELCVICKLCSSNGIVRHSFKISDFIY
ncbi:hypothetical protein Tco_0867048 [Tanacetum coccineum]